MYVHICCSCFISFHLISSHFYVLEEKHQREIRIQTRLIALDEMKQSQYDDDEDTIHVPVAHISSTSGSGSHSSRSGTQTPRSHTSDEMDLSNPYLQHCITQGLSKITNDLNTGNTHGIIICFDNDMLTYYICQFLVEQLQLVNLQAV